MRETSIATRLFASATLLSAIILFVAGIVLSAIYRRTTESAFDERLNVYLKELVGDISAPTEQERTQTLPVRPVAARLARSVGSYFLSLPPGTTWR